MKQEIKQQIGQSVQGFRLPRYQEIPDVGLYLEQATKYICRYLSPILETPLTASMISNYVKRGLLSSPVKKQYSRDQSCLDQVKIRDAKILRNQKCRSSHNRRHDLSAR